jgi:hypothetical protein
MKLRWADAVHVGPCPSVAGSGLAHYYHAARLVTSGICTFASLCLAIVQ